ncbi:MULTISPECIES: MFS transporter [Amycolatopsis]|uniref:MFS transporter n=1 Tax=Amycolatopsis TaxID=1813 RepID=UPI001E5A9A38|nr:MULTISPECIES: MFS transporter [Amycolatopsis]
MAGTPPTRASILLASCVGTSIKWYDSYVFGSASALVFGSLFFPSFSPLAGTLAAFGTFAVGFIARPLGGAVIGHFGDRIGRKSMLVLTLMLAGLATFLIGLLPTYAAIGVAAPILLVFLRLVQAFGVGGEWGGAVLVATEHATPRQRAVYGSFAQFGVPIGVLASNLVFLLVVETTGDGFATWGWRIPFLVSVALLVVGMLVRRTLTEPRVPEGPPAAAGQPGAGGDADPRAPGDAGAGEPRRDRAARGGLHGDGPHAQLRHPGRRVRAQHAADADPRLHGAVDRRIYVAARCADRWGSKRVYALGRGRGGRVGVPVVPARRHRQRGRGAAVVPGRRDRAGDHGRGAGRVVHRDLPGADAVQRRVDRLPDGRPGGRRGDTRPRRASTAPTTPRRRSRSTWDCCAR